MSRGFSLLLRCCCLFLVLLLCGCLAAGPPAATRSASPDQSLPNADGTLHAHTRAAGSESLILLTSATGASVATLPLPGRVAWLAWHPGGELLIVTTILKHYTFGATYLVRLHRWNGQAPPLSRTLADTTLKPLTLATWAAQLSTLPQPALGPQGDVLAFLRLHDPPAFDPYLKVILMALDGPGELALGRQTMPGAALSFSADGEVLSWSATTGDTISVQPWLGEMVPAEPGQRATAAGVDPVLLGLRPLLLQGLLSPEDYRRQWQQRRQP